MPDKSYAEVAPHHTGRVGRGQTHTCVVHTYSVGFGTAHYGCAPHHHPIPTTACPPSPLHIHTTPPQTPLSITRMHTNWHMCTRQQRHKFRAM